MGWTKTFHKRATKNDLRGKNLTVFADKAPRERELPSGALMYELEVLEPSSNASYKILVTDLDLTNICDIVNKGKEFTFDDKKPWANVAEVKD